MLLFSKVQFTNYMPLSLGNENWYLFSEEGISYKISFRIFKNTDWKFNVLADWYFKRKAVHPIKLIILQVYYAVNINSGSKGEFPASSKQHLKIHKTNSHKSVSLSIPSASASYNNRTPINVTSVSPHIWLKAASYSHIHYLLFDRKCHWGGT